MKKKPTYEQGVHDGIHYALSIIEESNRHHKSIASIAIKLIEDKLK